MTVKPFWGAVAKPAAKGQTALLHSAILACEANNPAAALACLMVLRKRIQYAKRQRDDAARDDGHDEPKEGGHDAVV